MQDILRQALKLALLSALVAGSAFASPQSQDSPSQEPAKTPPPAQPQTPQQTGSQPVQQKDTVTPKNSKEDVEAIGNRNVGKGMNLYSLEREISLGKSLAQEVERSSKLIDDPVVTEYVNRVGQNLVRNSDARVPFTIKVIDSDEINAFALPGGFFYVNSGLILHAMEESELAGVMAHEISHVTARHGTKNATKGELMQLATIPLILLGPGGWAGYGIYQGLNLAIPVTYLKFSRDAEREADFLGSSTCIKPATTRTPTSLSSSASRPMKSAARAASPRFSPRIRRRPSASKTRKRDCPHSARQARVHRHYLRIRFREVPPPQHHVHAQSGR